MPVHQLSDIPAAERGLVQALARVVGVGSTSPSTVLKDPNRVLGQFDGWVAKGPVLVNGVEVLSSTLPAGPFQLSAPLAGVPLSDPSLVEIATDEFVPARHGLPDQRSLGLYFTRVCLEAGARTGG